MTDNTEAMELWREAVHAYGGESIPGETENYAAAIIAAKLAELRARIEGLEGEMRALSKVLADHLGGGSEWFKQIGDDYFVSAKAIEGELRRRKTDAQITKRALFRANATRQALEADHGA